MSATDLRKAAETLRERAQAATPGPWHARGDQMRATAADALVEDSILVAFAYATGHDHRLGFKKTGAAPDVDYAATVHPGVGLALANLLEDMAIMHEETAIDTTRWPSVMRVVAAINGGAS